MFLSHPLDLTVNVHMFKAGSELYLTPKNKLLNIFCKLGLILHCIFFTVYSLSGVKSEVHKVIIHF